MRAVVVGVSLRMTISADRAVDVVVVFPLLCAMFSTVVVSPSFF